jgi:hypothetical protein
VIAEAWGLKETFRSVYKSPDRTELPGVEGSFDLVVERLSRARRGRRGAL